MKTVPLREVAHSRSGEKGNKSTLSVIAYDHADYEMLRQQVTVDSVRRLYGPITKGEISRYEVPLIGALNFVLDEALEGGRTRTLAFEESGKALSSLMLTLPLQVPADYIGRSQRSRTPETGGADSRAAPADGKCIRLGSATAWSRDRFDCAAELIKEKSLDYLCFEAMSEVTMSAARVAGLERSDAPLYDPYLVERIEPILRECRDKGIRIISNQGWLDPVGAAKRIAELAESLGIADYKIAAVDGGGLTDRIADMGLSSVETGEPLAHRRAAWSSVT
jgi:hypothetical protein